MTDAQTAWLQSAIRSRLRTHYRIAIYDECAQDVAVRMPDVVTYIRGDGGDGVLIAAQGAPK